MHGALAMSGCMPILVPGCSSCGVFLPSAPPSLVDLARIAFAHECASSGVTLIVVGCGIFAVQAERRMRRQDATLDYLDQAHAIVRCTVSTVVYVRCIRYGYSCYAPDRYASTAVSAAAAACGRGRRRGDWAGGACCIDKYIYLSCRHSSRIYCNCALTPYSRVFASLSLVCARAAP